MEANLLQPLLGAGSGSFSGGQVSLELISHRLAGLPQLCLLLSQQCVRACLHTICKTLATAVAPQQLDSISLLQR